MKKIILAVAAAAIAVPAAAAPGNSDSSSGRATATVVAPIRIQHDGGALAFGTVIAGTGAGTVTVDAAGTATPGGDAVMAIGSTSSVDTFTVFGDAGRTFSVGVTSTGDTVDGISGAAQTAAASMAFTATPTATSGTLAGNGQAAVAVGGTLQVAANQASGGYEGTYDIAVAYN